MNKQSDKNLLSFCISDNPTIIKGLSIDDVGIKGFDIDSQKIVYEVSIVIFNLKIKSLGCLQCWM
jgi:hypothetical protein